MAVLKADDDVHRLAYTWYGPKLEGGLSIFRFKGRVLTEWAILVALFVLLWRFGGPLVDLVAHEPLSSLVLRIGLAWGAGSYLARVAHDRLVDSDRPARYVLRCVGVECWRAWRSRGPVDWWVLLAGIVPWWMATRVGLLVLPGLLAALLAIIPAAFMARRLVCRFESPDRARRRLHARLERSAAPIHLEVSP